MDTEAEDLLRQMTEAHGVPGHEDEVRDLFRAGLEGAGDFATDRTGSVLCDAGGEGPRVLLAAHMDEVGFRVQSITSAGFLQLVAVGGWWTHTLLSQQVVIKTAGGDKFTGVVASKPPHFLSERERKVVMPLDQMFVDVGARNREEVLEWGIQPGDAVAPASSFQKLAGEGRYLAKAFDNRAGMAAVVLAGKRLRQGERPNHLLLGGTVQEEVGLRGAQTLAAVARPEVAVLLEGTPADDTPGFDLDVSQAKLAGGVQIRLHDPSAIMNPRLAALAVETGEVEVGIMPAIGPFRGQDPAVDGIRVPAVDGAIAHVAAVGAVVLRVAVLGRGLEGIVGVPDVPHPGVEVVVDPVRAADIGAGVGVVPEAHVVDPGSLHLSAGPVDLRSVPPQAILARGIPLDLDGIDHTGREIVLQPDIKHVADGPEALETILVALQGDHLVGEVIDPVILLGQLMQGPALGRIGVNLGDGPTARRKNVSPDSTTLLQCGAVTSGSMSSGRPCVSFLRGKRRSCPRGGRSSGCSPIRANGKMTANSRKSARTSK